MRFRLADRSKGRGVFARADGANEHHSIFWVNADLPITPGKDCYMHTAFGLEDIDEVMLGANQMAEKGWINKSMNSSGGLVAPSNFLGHLLNDGVDHVSVDNMSYGRTYIADWIAETFGTRVG